jgi:phosphatidylinositol N-acetylglucosaminyltransferase subunit A
LRTAHGKMPIITKVSTNVGGVPEVLSDKNMITMVEPSVEGLYDGLCHVIDNFEKMDIDPEKFHQKVKDCYYWENITNKVENVYYNLIKNEEKESKVKKLIRFNELGIFFGKICCFVYLLGNLLMIFLDYFFPKENIEFSIDFNSNNIDKN